jgi:hypothetical protein
LIKHVLTWVFGSWVALCGTAQAQLGVEASSITFPVLTDGGRSASVRTGSEAVLTGVAALGGTVVFGIGATTTCDTGDRIVRDPATDSVSPSEFFLNLVIGTGRTAIFQQIRDFPLPGFASVANGLSTNCLHRYKAIATQGEASVDVSVRVRGVGVGFTIPGGQITLQDPEQIPFSITKPIRFQPTNPLPVDAAGGVICAATAGRPFIDGQEMANLRSLSNEQGIDLPVLISLACNPFVFDASSITFSGALTPIVVDLGAPGLDLTGVEDGVLFDLDADGRLELTSWTSAGARDAFLVVDRNGNRTIDDGMELFGNAVELRDGSVAMQGYAALAEFDLPELGGNANGFADIGDSGYWKLRLWTDANHNGISEKDELKLLFSEGIFAISLDFSTSDAVDEHGNRLAFSSPAYARGPRGLREIATTDVFFQVLDLD